MVVNGSQWKSSNPYGLLKSEAQHRQIRCSKPEKAHVKNDVSPAITSKIEQHMEERDEPRIGFP